MDKREVEMINFLNFVIQPLPREVTEMEPVVEPVKVIMRYTDGRIIKGFTNDFFPNKPVFHVHPSENDPANKAIEVNVGQLKAVFFVKDFTGNKSYDERKHFEEGAIVTGRKMEVTFNDGEVLVGTTVGYTPNRQGFFVHPADSGSNNLRVYVVSPAVKKVRFL